MMTAIEGISLFGGFKMVLVGVYHQRKVCPSIGERKRMIQLSKEAPPNPVAVKPIIKKTEK
jgi:hypothetical protein